MNDEVKLSRLLDRLSELNYPKTREEAADECRGTTLTYADGEHNLGELIEGMNDRDFQTANELYEALQMELPIEALGEPGQSDGDA